MRELNEVIAQITWTVQDVCDAFCKKFGRDPTECELSACLKSFSAKQLEDRSTEFGWDFIYDAVEKTVVAISETPLHPRPHRGSDEKR